MWEAAAEMDWNNVGVALIQSAGLWTTALLFLAPLKKKETHWARRAALCVLAGAAVLILVSAVLADSAALVWVQPFLCCGLVAFLFWQCADLGLKAVVYCGVWVSMLCDLAAKAGEMLLYLFQSRGMVLAGWLAFAGLWGVFAALVGSTFARWMPDKGRYHTGPRQFTFAMGLWAADLTVDLLYSAFDLWLGGAGGWAVVLLIKCYCVTVLYLQHGLFQKSAIRQELAMLNTLWLQQKNQYDLAKENIALINRKCHDMKHQIRAMRVIFSDESREKYLQEVERSVRIYEVLAKTGNEVLDTVLTEKSLLCEANGIQANCVADGRLLAFMDPVDLYTIFGNAMDNAIESVSAIEDVTRRIIDVQVYSEKQMLVVQIINPVAHPVTFDEEDFPISTKEKNGYHGFGLRSIRHTAKKYGGFTTVRVEDGSFYLRILLPMQQAAQPD